MKHLWGKFSKSIWWRWILSYAVIMIIPLLFGMVIYIYALNTIKEEVVTVQEQSIEQVRMGLDNVMDNLYKVSYTLASSAYNSGIYTERSGEDGYNPLSVRQVQKTMASYYIANDKIGKIYMYFPENDYILTGDLTYKYRHIRGNTPRFLNMSEPDFTRITEQNANGVLLSVNRAESAGKEESSKALYYVYGGKEFGGRIIVFIPLNMQSLEEMVSIEHTGVYLLLKEASLRIGGSDEVIPEQVQTNSNSDLSHFTEGHMYWMKAQLKSTDDALATCIDGDFYFEKIHKMQWILIFYLGVSLSLAGAAAYRFSKSHYTPIEKLMQGVDPAFEKGRSEYDTLTEYYTSMQQAYKNSQEELLANRRELHNSRMAGLLKCDDLRQTQRLWQELNKDGGFLSGSYLLAGIVIPHGEREVLTDDSEFLLSCFIVDNIVSEILEKGFQVISGEVDGFLVYIVRTSSSGHDGDFPARVIQSLEYAGYYIDQYFHISFGVNVSRESENFMCIGSCFEEIKELQEYRDWNKSDALRIYTAGRLYFPEAQEQQSVDNYHKHTAIMTAMKSGDYIKAESLLSSMLKKEQHEPVIKTMTGKRKDVIIDEIVNYIEDHYDDWQLSGKMFAEKYNISLSYLSQIFKKEKGVGLLDYINQIRYIKAKAMIEAGATIQEAAAKAGYATTQPLRRLFRQFEGVTPSESRKRKQES